MRIPEKTTYLLSTINCSKNRKRKRRLSRTGKKKSSMRMS